VEQPKRRPKTGIIVGWIALALTGLAFAAWSAARAMGGPEMSVSPEWQPTAHDFAFAVAMRRDQPYAVGNFGITRGKPGTAAPDSAKTPRTWEKVADTGAESLLGIAFSPDGSGVAAGQLGLMLGAAAHSDNWRRIESGNQRRLFAVAASDEGVFLVAGELGTLLYRRQGGARFETVKTKWAGFEAPNLYDATFISSDTAIAVGESGAIVTVTDGLITTTLETGPESLYAVVRCGEGLYSVGQEGRVEIKRGRGDWQASTVPGAPDLYGAACIQSSTLAAVGAGSLYLTSGLGDTLSWHQITLPSVQAPWFSGVVALAPQPALLLTGPGGLWEARLSDAK